MNSIPSTSEMQQAYLQRDPSYDGLFFVGVRTTGIFCRPTCPARKPRPENVEYLRTVRAALAAGYRPCKRCRPLARAFGEAPGEHRDSECVFLSWLRSPLGPLVAGATAKGICLLEFTDRRMLEAEFAAVRKMFNVPLVPGSNDHLVRLKVELAGYCGGSALRFTVPLV